MVLPVLTVAGGVALILLGAGELRRALDRLFGIRLEGWIQGLAATRGRAFASGLGLSLLAPSSTTMAMLAIETVDEHLASPAQILAMLLGAGIGLTATIQLVAFRLSAYAPAFVLAGYLLNQVQRAPRVRQAARMVIGLGLIFLGIGSVQGGLGTAMEAAPGALAGLEHRPAVLFAAALVLSAATQSATATVAIAIALSESAVLSLRAAVPWVVGANLGIALTVLIGGFAHREARRVGSALTLAQALVGLPATVWAGEVAEALRAMPGTTAHDLANAHTAFNAAVAAIGLLLLTPLLQVVARVVPAPSRSRDSRWVDCTLPREPAESFTLAAAQVRRELLRIGHLIGDDFRTAWRGVAHGDAAATESVRAYRMAADRLFARLRAYLARLSTHEGQVHDHETAQPIALARTLAELEILHGAVATDLTRVGRRLQVAAIRFSSQGQLELDGFAAEIARGFDSALAALSARDAPACESLAAELRSLAERAHELRDLHLERLRQGLPESLESSLLHLDVLTFLRLIAEHLAGLANTGRPDAS